MGHGVELFLDDENDIPEEFKCSICQDVLEKVTMTHPCEHAFCTACIQQWFLTNPNLCPVDRQRVTMLKKPQRVYMNLLHRLKLNCPYCHYELQLGDFDHHNERCKFNPENHKECAKGCGAIVMLYEIKAHSCVAYLKQQLKTREIELASQKREMTDLKYNLFLQGFEADVLKEKVKKQKAATKRGKQNMVEQINEIKELKIKLNSKKVQVKILKSELRKTINRRKKYYRKLNEFSGRRRQSSFSNRWKQLAIAYQTVRRRNKAKELGQAQQPASPSKQTAPIHSNANTVTNPTPCPLIHKIQCNNTKNISKEMCAVITEIFARAVAPYYNNSNQKVWQSLRQKWELRYVMEEKIIHELLSAYGDGWNAGLIYDISTPNSTTCCIGAERSTQLTLGNLTFGIWKLF